MKNIVAITAALAVGGTGVVLADYSAEALADQITALPGAEDIEITFNQFSGYLKVNNTKNLHYW